MGSYNYYKMFGCFNRKFKISESEPPPDVREAFRQYAEDAPNMTAMQLLNFMVEYQGEEGLTTADAEVIMQHVCQHRHHSAKHNGFTLEDFFYFLFQDDLNGPIHTKVHHDMTAPLHHYFIYTGHNSYLTGNQLSSDSSEIPIIRSLENGVRGIELDLWPNSAKDNVHVLHGRTLTPPIPLVKCLKSIKEHAFVKSPYPVIITLEDHLTPDLQAKVAEMVTKIFGDMLYHPESGCLEEFPSPEALKHRIMLSTQPPKEHVHGIQLGLHHRKDSEASSPGGKDSSEDEQSLKEASFHTAQEGDDYKSDSDHDEEDRDHSHQKSGNLAAPPEYKRLTAFHAGNAKKGLRRTLRCKVHRIKRLNSEGSSPGGKDSSDDEQSVKEASFHSADHEGDDYKSDSDHDEEDRDHSHNKSGNLAAPPEYKRLIAIHAGNAKKGLKRTLRGKVHKAKRLSLSEKELEKAASLYTDDVLRFTQENIMRVFPKGTRVTSSNFEPINAWMHGAQMIAFNMQGYGKSLWLMHGLFRANGGSGYVKKPDLLMRRGPNNEVFDPKQPMPVKKTLKVRVYMGDGWRLDFSHTHFDAYSPPDFYTKVHIIGVPADAAKKKTRIIPDDWAPFWDEQFTFSLRVPELALLRIEVREHDMSDKDDFGGQTCLPVTELRPGIRSVPLYDKKGQKYKSVRLLMHFRFE